MSQYDVVIIGGGGAGLMLARELGKAKHTVLILDRKENLLDFSFYTLASFMEPKDFNLSENVVAQEIDKICLHSKRFQTELKANIYTIDKRKLHEEIIQTLDTKYVTFKLGVHISGIEEHQNRYTSVVDKEGNTYTAKIFVDASGTNGVLSKKVGLQKKKPELATAVEYNVKYLGNTNEIHLLIGKIYQGGYGWIFPLQDDRAIIGFGTHDKEMIKGLKTKLNKIIELPKIKKLVLKDTEKVEGGSIPITPVIETFIQQNLVCVGDSVSQVNPVVGEGYKFIFESAIMASQAIHKSLVENSLDSLSEYESNWQKRFSLNYKRSKIAQQRISKFSKKDLLIDVGMLLAKLRSNKKNIQSLSGEYEK